MAIADERRFLNRQTGTRRTGPTATNANLPDNFGAGMLQPQVPSLLRPLLDLLPWQQLFLVAAVVGSLAVARRLTSGDWRWGDRLRSRFVLGVPWGTLLTMLGVLLVYWVVQGGWAHPRNPMVVPFRSWSYFYSVGTLVADTAVCEPGNERPDRIEVPPRPEGDDHRVSRVRPAALNHPVDE